MCPSFHLDAPAKVNLGLRVVGRRDDGYHELESLFVPLDLADGIALQVETSDDASVVLRLAGDDVGAPPGEDNLAIRAARSFLAETGLRAHVEIGLTKRTPAAAGLGGGSSDAAAVLRGLRRAFPDALEPERLEALALSLGADVPYFLDPVPAWVTGVGERRQPTHESPSWSLLLANPGVALATSEVFGAFDALGRGYPKRRARPAPLPGVSATAEEWQALLHNDLEDAALRLCPAIGRLRQALDALEPQAVGMSGSGATLFAVYSNPGAAEGAEERLELPPGGWKRVATIRESG